MPDPDDEWVGRNLKNAFGFEEPVVLMVRHWKHFDWLVSIGQDMESFVKDCDMKRHDFEGFRFTFSGFIEANLVSDERLRHLDGEDIPLFINPNGYLKTEEKSFGEQEVQREVTNAAGEIIELQLPRSYWRYLHWLGDQGTDISQYIINADRLREQPKWERHTLRGVLQEILRADEKRRFMSDEPSPLFINPDGYDL